MRDEIKGFLRRIRKFFLFLIFCVAIYAFVLVPILVAWTGLKQKETIEFLADIVNSEFANYDQNSQWSDSFRKIRWYPPDNPQYTFFLSPTEHSGRTLEELGLSLPIDFSVFGAPEPGVSKNGFIAVAIGSAEWDDNLDVWWIDNNNQPICTQNSAEYWPTFFGVIKKAVNYII